MSKNNHKRNRKTVHKVLIAYTSEVFKTFSDSNFSIKRFKSNEYSRKKKYNEDYND